MSNRNHYMTRKKVSHLKWNGEHEGAFDFTMLDVLGEFAKSYENNPIPSLSDLELLAWALTQPETYSPLNSNGYLNSPDDEGNNTEPQPKRPRMRKGSTEWEPISDVKSEPAYDPSDMNAYDNEDGTEQDGEKGHGARAFYGRASKGYNNRGRPSGSATTVSQKLQKNKLTGEEETALQEAITQRLDLDRTKRFFDAIFVMLGKAADETVRMLEFTLDLYKQRAIDYLAVAAIVQALLKDNSDLLKEFFAVTSPESIPGRPEPPKGRFEPQAIWNMTREESRKVPLTKKLAERQAQSAFIPPDDAARAFLIRAKVELGADYSNLLDHLVAMRMSFRANQLAALEMVSCLVVFLLHVNLSNFTLNTFSHGDQRMRFWHHSNIPALHSAQPSY